MLIPIFNTSQKPRTIVGDIHVFSTNRQAYRTAEIECDNKNSLLEATEIQPNEASNAAIPLSTKIFPQMNAKIYIVECGPKILEFRAYDDNELFKSYMYSNRIPFPACPSSETSKVPRFHTGTSGSGSRCHSLQGKHFDTIYQLVFWLVHTREIQFFLRITHVDGLLFFYRLCNS